MRDGAAGVRSRIAGPKSGLDPGYELFGFTTSSVQRGHLIEHAVFVGPAGKALRRLTGTERRPFSGKA